MYYSIYVEKHEFETILTSNDVMNIQDTKTVSDDTVHKGTSKLHKTDGKSTHFVVDVSP